MPLAHAWRLVVDVDHLVMTSEATTHYLASCTKLIERQLEVGGPTTADMTTACNSRNRIFQTSQATVTLKTTKISKNFTFMNVENH
jgi:hypothetical protein